MTSDSRHGRRLVAEEGDYMRMKLDTRRTEVNGIWLWYLSHLLIYSSVSYQDCESKRTWSLVKIRQQELKITFWHLPWFFLQVFILIV